MIKKTLITMLALSINISATEKTIALRNEFITHSAPNLRQETHPTIYKMVQELTTKADISMPRYITVFEAQRTVVQENGVVQNIVRDMEPFVDIWG